MEGQTQHVPFDEGPALEELERIRLSIDEWRARRKQAEAAFDQFVSGFKTPQASLPVDAATPVSPRPSAGTPTDVIDAPLIPAESAPAIPRFRALRKSRATGVFVLAGVAVAAGAGFLLTRPPRPNSTESANPRFNGSPRPAPQPQPVTSPNVPPSVAVNVAERRSEIIVLRRVWIRVTVDGTRQVERELPAGERITLAAGRTVVVRAGDAGALRLKINGEDRGTLGHDGEIATRTLKIPLNR